MLVATLFLDNAIYMLPITLLRQPTVPSLPPILICWNRASSSTYKPAERYSAQFSALGDLGSFSASSASLAIRMHTLDLRNVAVPACGLRSGGNLGELLGIYLFDSIVLFSTASPSSGW